VRSFQKSDYLRLCDWMIKRELDVPAFDHLPPTGLIVDNVACGFLIKCDNNWGILDFFVSNPEMPEYARGSAIDEIARSLISLAIVAGVKVLKCDTSIISIYRLAIKHGFHAVGSYKSMVREI
jgi:hypothetical protein